LKAIVARKRWFTADLDSSSRLVSTENKRQAAPNQPPATAVPTDSARWHPRLIEQTPDKWISNQRTDTNFKAATKAVAFADTYMNVNSLVLLPYDWKESSEPDTWLLHHIDDQP
jgi:hypothetical protein